jgi:hypothetical protein
MGMGDQSQHLLRTTPSGCCDISTRLWTAIVSQGQTTTSTARVKRSDAPAIQLFHKDEIIFKIHDARDTMPKMKWDHPEWKKDIKGVPFQVTANCTLDWECWIATRCKNNANCDGSGWTTTSEKRPRPSAQDARL